MEIAELDLAGPHRAAWLELQDLVHREQNPGFPPYTPAMHLAHTEPRRDERIRLWAAVENGRLLGASSAVLFADTNAHLAAGGVSVHPDHRGRGVGRALADALLVELRAEGRAAFLCDTPEGGAGEAGAAFARSYGCKPAQTEVSNVQRVAEAPAELADWAQGSAARTAGWTMLRWADRCPEELLAEFASAQSGLNDMPTGEMDLRPYTITPAQLRRSEDWGLRHGMHRHAVAVREDATGRIGGYSTVTLDEGWPWARVGSTAVLSWARGNGFGLWLKAALVQWLREKEPWITAYVTGNAAENAPMLAINTKLGYRPAATYQVWQAEL